MNLAWAVAEACNPLPFAGLPSAAVYHTCPFLCKILTCVPDAGGVDKIIAAVPTVYWLISSPCHPQTNSLFPLSPKQKPLGLVSWVFI